MEYRQRIGRWASRPVPRGLPAFWGVVTVIYAAIVVYRAAATGKIPGFPTVAGSSAVAAVWLELWDRSHHSGVIQVAVAVAMLLTLVSNGYVAAVAYGSSGVVPVGRALLALLFAHLLILKLLGFVLIARNKE